MTINGSCKQYYINNVNVLWLCHWWRNFVNQGETVVSIDERKMLKIRVGSIPFYNQLGKHRFRLIGRLIFWDRLIVGSNIQIISGFVLRWLSGLLIPVLNPSLLGVLNNPYMGGGGIVGRINKEEIVFKTIQMILWLFLKSISKLF